MPFMGFEIGDFAIGDDGDVESLLSDGEDSGEVGDFMVDGGVGDFGIGDYEIGDYEIGDYEIGDYEIGASLFPAQRLAAARNPRSENAIMPTMTRRGMPPARLLPRATLQAPTLVHEIEPTKARQFPLGIDSVTTVAAAATTNLTTRPQDVYRVERLVVPSSIAQSFIINDIKVGKNSQLVNSVALPAQMFTEGAFGVRLRCDTAQVGADISVNVTNISAGALRFLAGIVGVALE